MRDASAGLLEERLRLAERVTADRGDGEMEGLRADVERVATDALLFHAPVAGDLRVVVSAIHSSADLIRMGVLARHVAEVALRKRPPCAVPDEVRPAFVDMSRLGVAMALKAAEVTRTRNVVLAIELGADDDEMDALHGRMFGVLMDRTWPHGVASAVDVTLLARYYERFADHAVTVAGETVTAVTGREPRDVAAMLDGRGD
jgi:phosphate transport system protein